MEAFGGLSGENCVAGCSTKQGRREEDHVHQCRKGLGLLPFQFDS